MLLFLVKPFTTMLRRSSLSCPDISALSLKQKNDVFEKHGFPRNIFAEKIPRTLSYGKKEIHSDFREEFQALTVLYKRTDTEVVKELNFNLLIYHQFQSSIMLSENVMCIKNDIWTFITQKNDFSFVELDEKENSPFEPLKQHFLSIVEAYRILELNHAVFSTLKRNGPFFSLPKD